MNMQIQRYYSGIFSGRKWFDSSNHASVLTRTSRLFLVQIIEFAGGEQRLAERNLRLAHDDRTAVFAFHTLRVNFQMQFAHSGRNRLFIVRIVHDL